MRLTDTPSFEIIQSKFKEFLEHRNWTYSGEIPEVASVWKKYFNKKNSEILIPINPSVDDWFSAFRDALKTLSQAENMDPKEIGRYLLNNSKNDEVVSIRAHGSLCTNNSLPLSYGIELHEGFGVLIYDGAKEYFNNIQRSIPKEKRDKQSASHYLSQIKLTQSSAGSYIINAELPKLHNDVFSESYSGIIKNIQDSIDRIIEFSQRDKISEVEKLSINTRICDALLNFGGAEEDQDIEIIFKKYSANVKDGFSKRNINLAKDAFPKIRKLSFYCKENKLPDNRDISGFITRLDREVGDRSGIIYVACRINSKSVKLKIKLEKIDYKTAINAHEMELPVSFNCNVLNIGRRWFGDNIKNFSTTKGTNMSLPI